MYNDFQYRLVLLPGSRGDRAKWKHSCQEVECLVFVASLSEYDQVSKMTIQSLRIPS